MFCTRCGKQIEGGVRFCTYCGKPVSKAVAAQPAPVVETVAPKSKKGGKVAIAVVLAILLFAGSVALGWFVGFSMGDGDKQTSSTVSEDNKDKDDKDQDDKDQVDKDKEADDKKDADKKDIEDDKADKNQKVQPDSYVAEQGKVLNIYSWNTEFQSCMEDYYPGYEVVDSATGRIGDVTVKYIIVPEEDNEYKNNLDATLMNQKDAPADEKVDIFLVESSYAMRYVDTEYAMTLSDLGISDDDIAGQFEFTQKVATDSSGNKKGVSWQACPGVVIYNREIAKEVWGTDDPRAIQQKISTWNEFEQAAKALKDKGYCITASVYDTYPAYSCNRSSAWVVDGKINVDANVQKWAEDSKELYKAGYTDTDAIWGNKWREGFYPKGKVFCYFASDWFLNYSMDAYVEGSVSYSGDWAVTEGPGPFFWGGSWICAAQGTDNEELIRDIMLKMTCNEAVLKTLADGCGDSVNNVNIMTEKALDSDDTNPIIGGQNPWQVYINNAQDLNLDYITYYDEICDSEFQNAMLNYITGSDTYQKALENFYSAVIEKHPELSY